MGNNLYPLALHTKKIFVQNIGTSCEFPPKMWCKVRGRGLYEFQLHLTGKIIPRTGVLGDYPSMGYSHPLPIAKREGLGKGAVLEWGEAVRSLEVRDGTHILITKTLFLHFDLEHPWGPCKDLWRRRKYLGQSSWTLWNCPFPSVPQGTQPDSLNLHTLTF